jgi:O-antigen/teichoic acid export membrane protein
MTLAQKVLSDAIVSAGKTVFSITRGLVAIPLITNLLNESAYGVWVIILSVLAILRSIGGVHLFGALIRYQDNDCDSEQTYADIVVTAAATGAATAGLYYLLLQTDLAREILSLSGPVGQQLAVVSAALVLSDIVLTIHTAFIRSKGWVKTSDIVITVRMAVETLGLIAVLFYFRELIAGLAWLLAVSVLFTIGLAAYVNISFSVPRPQVGNIPKYLRYGAPMIPKQVSNSLLTDADKYLLLYFFSPKVVGVYAVVYSLSRFLRNLSGILNPTLYPTVSQAWRDGDIDEVERLYGQIFRYYTVLAVPAFVGLWFLAEPLLRLISTAEIAREGHVIFPILGVAFLVQGYQNALEYVLTAAEETAKIGFAVVFATVVNLALNVVFIPRLELIGAAQASLVASATLTALIFLYASSYIDISYPLVPLGRSAVASAVMVGCLLIVPTSGRSLFGVILSVGIGFIVYMAVIVAIGGLSTSELQGTYRAVRSLWQS